MKNFSAIYGLAHFGKSLIWHSSGLLFAFFLTEICAVPPTAMGWILACDMLFSGAADAGFGRLLRQRVATVALAGRLQWLGVVASALLLLAFAVTPYIWLPARILYAVITCLSFRLAYSFQDVPENAMLYLAKGDTGRRVELSSVRFVASGLASLVVAMAASLLIGGDLAQRARLFLLFTAAIVLIWLAVSLTLKRAAQRQTEGIAAKEPGPPSGRASLPMPALALSSGALIRLMMLVGGGNAAFGILLPYYAAQALDQDAVRMISLALIGLGNVAAQPLWIWVCRRHGTVIACRAAASAAAIGAICFFVAALFRDLSAAFAGLILESGLGGLSMLLWASFAEQVSRGAHVTLTRSPTLAMGLFTCAIKISGAAVLLLIGQLLAHIDYRDMMVATSWRLLLPMTGLPLLAGCFCLLTGANSGTGEVRTRI
jgi:Na+/melibiose symporter-like transporter